MEVGGYLCAHSSEQLAKSRCLRSRFRPAPLTAFRDGRIRPRQASWCLSVSLALSLLLTHSLTLSLTLPRKLASGEFHHENPFFSDGISTPFFFFFCCAAIISPRQWSALAPSANVRRCARVKLTLSHGEEEPVPERFAFTALGYANQAPTL